MTYLAAGRPRYKSAICLDYDERFDEAPHVGAKAENYAADHLVDLARRFGVPIVEKPELARMLQSVDTGLPLPKALYEAVAVVFAHLQKATCR